MQPALYWIEAPFPGKVAISARPRGGDWLEDEITAWRQAGIDTVISLLTPDEVNDLNLNEEARLSEVHSMRFCSFPIPDRSIPSSRAETSGLVKTLRSELDAGRNLVVHCRQGVGRSGLIAAALLISGGIGPEEALRRITDARGVPVPETSEQRAWVLHLADVSGAP